MSDKFPHLTNNESTFPNVKDVNVYKFDNDFDYTRFNYSQMHLIICNVPWDMGEAHIGARTISGIGNVVHFGTEAKRDAWFAAIPNTECYRFDTKYKNLHRDEYIDVPLPFDVASKYNYLAVSYELFANANSHVMYENSNGLEKWFWFIREVEFVAPNTTRLHVLNDAFQTFIYGIDVTGMILARGHAPMIANKVSTYLANPIANCADLLAEDVNYGNGHDISVKSYEKVFNAANMGVLVICTSNPQSGSWGTKADGTWNTPARKHPLVQGNENYLSFFIKGASNITAFLNNVDSSCPQFMQTIQAVAFVSEDLLTLGSSFTFCSMTCYRVEATYKKTDFATIAKADFGFDSKYANIAKLYTYPYSYLEVTDEMGNVTEVRIENTTGKITLEHSVSLVYPWLNVNAHISNVGKASRKTVSFANATSRNMPIGGNWYEYLYKWEIPTFAVTQDAALNNDYSTHFDRSQQQTAASNQLANANASATTTQANANDTASTNQTNANNTASANLANANSDASTTTAIGNLQVALNNAITSACNSKTSTSATISNALSSATTAAASALTNASTNNQIDYKYATGTTAAASSALNGAISGGSTLAAGGPYAAAAGALLGGTIGAVSAGITTQAGINYDSAQAGAANNQMSRNNTASQTATSDEATASITLETDKNSANNSYTSGASSANAANIVTKGTNSYNASVTNAANQYATDTGNATRSYNTDTGNATRSYNTEISAIANQINQAALGTPEVFGDFANGDDAANKPMGLFANIITQNDYAISRAGDDMLRYGYMYGKQWPFDGNWTPGEKFTYWKLDDFWVKNLSIGDMYMDKLRFFLYGGVTMWKKPEDIGNVSIYQNGF